MTDQPFSSFYRRYYHRLVYVAERVLGDHHLAEDVAQTTMLRAYERLPDDIKDVWPLIRRIAVNAALNLKRERRGQLLHEEIPDAPLQGDLPVEVVLDVTRAVSNLPRRHSEAIRLSYWEGRSRAEIARIQGTTANSVKDRLRYARQLLHTKLGGARAMVPGLGTKSALRMKAVQKSLQVGLISLASITAITTITQVPKPPLESEPRTPASSTAQREQDVAVSPSGGSVFSGFLTTPDDPASHRHQIVDPIGGAEIGNGEEPGSAGVYIGPITMNCDPDQQGPITTVVCDVLSP